MLLAISLAMNTASVIQVSVQPMVGPAAAARPDKTANAGAAPSAFAGALNAAGAKPGRRGAAAKQSDDGASGGSLPPGGNPSPPVPPAASAPNATTHAHGDVPPTRARKKPGNAGGPATVETPPAIQAIAGGGAAMIGGAEALPKPMAVAAARNAAVNPGTFAAVGAQPGMQTRTDSGLAAAAATAAAEPAAAVANGAAAKQAEPTPIASAVSAASKIASTLDASTTPDQSANTEASPATAVIPAAAAANSPPAASSAKNAPPAASAAAGNAAPPPRVAALRSAPKSAAQPSAPAQDSSAVAGTGSAADSAFPHASAASGEVTPAGGGSAEPLPAAAAAAGANDPAATAAAAIAGTPQPANTANTSGENSYDSDASIGAPGASAGADIAAAAPAPARRSGMLAEALPLITPNAASAPLAVDAGKHAPAGFDLAALTGNAGDAAAGLSQLTANAPAAAPAESTPTAALRIHASVDSADFTQGLSERVSWMVDNGVNGAKLQVNPPQLGPIELRISVQGDHAQVWMATHSAVARDALESSSPKLREMLTAQGFGQVSVDISQRSFQDRSAYTPPYQRESAAGSAPTITARTATVSTARTSLGALDAYA